MRIIVLGCISIFFGLNLQAQQYTVNGNATQDNCHCYTLTPNLVFTSGSVWNNTRINLNNLFDFTFDVNLGCTDSMGADGIVFVLQPISTSVGSAGGGLGFGNINPSIGITLDTYQNISPDDDPEYDHIAIQKNGLLNHLLPENLAGPVPISASNNNVEDCQDHRLRIKWDPVTHTLSTWFDGVARLSIVNDLVATTFNGDPLVFWGFTGSTGGLFNLQKFCTALSPSWTLGPAQNRCLNEAIRFNDATVSFTTVAKMYWNFGDGSPIDSVNQNPVHTYSIAGVYTVTQKVRGADGCEETNTQQLTVGDKPIPGFTTMDDCVMNNISFTDNSSLTQGTVSSNFWNFGNGMQSTNNPAMTTYPTPGNYTIKHAVTSSLGCKSDTLYRTFHVFGRPLANFSFTDSVCLSTPITFLDQSTVPPDTVNTWIWNIDNGATILRTKNITYNFTTPGLHQVSLIVSADSSAGCISVIAKQVFIIDKPIAAFKKINSCDRQVVQFQDSSYTRDGQSIVGWWWNLGNGQISTQQNPSVTFGTAGSQTIKLVVRNSRGCLSDTLTTTININALPVANFIFGEPACGVKNVMFNDVSTAANGTVTAWAWVYNQAVFSNASQPTQTFTEGVQRVGLIVKSSLGCISDTVFKSFTIKAKPVVEMQFRDACKGTPVTFSGVEISNLGIDTWQWDFGDGTTGTGNPVNHTYTLNKLYTVKLLAVSSQGCASEEVSRQINIYGTNAFAGNDTVATVNQPIQLNATGGISYTWSPAAGLSATDIPNPIATNATDRFYYLKASTPEGCESYDTLLVKIYEGPEIYVPNAFTPNNDGLNDQVRALPVGISKFLYFRIYNRWGQMIFTTSDYRKGWDSSIKGLKQSTGTYIWIAAAVDFKGNFFSRKGTVTIIR
ncbi:MAG: PKD domain-containing protein [Ferruginibacter sp.]